MNNAKKIVDEINLIAEGFAKVPVVERPPKVKWGDEFKAWDDEKKIQYLTKFAEAMNHAAAKIQQERDTLGELIEKKEDQIQQMKMILDLNNNMLQHEVTRMNNYKQDMNDHAAKLNARIKELERGHH